MNSRYIHKHSYNIGWVFGIVWFAFLLPCLGQDPWSWDGEFWGAETNGVQSGLDVQHSFGSKNTILTRCTPVFRNNRTNNGNRGPARLLLYLPPMESFYQLSLLDEKGNRIVRTKKGESFGKQISKPLFRSTGINYNAGYRAYFVDRDQPQGIADCSFILQDYFDVTNTGRFHLKVEMQAAWITPNWTASASLRTTNLPMVHFPPIDAFITIEDRNSKE